MGNNLVIIYDSECGICIATKKKVNKFDNKKLITWKPIKDIKDDVFYEKFKFKDYQLQKEMHLIEDGRYIFKGYFAFKRIVPILKYVRFLTPIFHLPFSTVVGTKIYSNIAKKRKQNARSTCINGRCNI